MSQYDPKKIEELQIVLLKDPRSPVFASLAEAYRKMELFEEALEVTTRGVRHNPEYVSGLVAHAKVLYELKDYTQAVEFLQKGTALNPNNILALRLLGHCLFKMRQHKPALRAYKKLLVVSPNDEGAIKFIKKWEFLDNLPAEKDQSKFNLEGQEHWITQLPSEDHVLHIIDSFMNSDDTQNALEVANLAVTHWPQSTALKHRQELLLDSPENEREEPVTDDNPALVFLRAKRAFYERWLQRSEQLKTIDPR